MGPSVLLHLLYISYSWYLSLWVHCAHRAVSWQKDGGPGHAPLLSQMTQYCIQDSIATDWPFELCHALTGIYISIMPSPVLGVLVRGEGRVHLGPNSLPRPSHTHLGVENDLATPTDWMNVNYRTMITRLPAPKVKYYMHSILNKQ